MSGMTHALAIPLAFDLGAPELLIILAVIVLLFGASKLPELARGSGRALRRGQEPFHLLRFGTLSSGRSETTLARGASRQFRGGTVRQTIVEMEHGFLFVTAIGDGSCLALLSTAGADIGLIAYEMALLVVRVGEFLTPDLRAEMQAALPR